MSCSHPKSDSINNQIFYACAPERTSGPLATSACIHLHLFITRRRVTVLVLCVCLSVTTLAATSAISTLKMRYEGLFLGFSRFEFSSVQKLWREKANMQMMSM